MQIRPILFIAGLLLNTAANADNPLFPTHILAPGTVDALLQFSHDTHGNDLVFRGDPGRQSLALSEESLQVRYGLGDNWHMGAAVAYASRDIERTDFSSPARHFTNQDNQGWHNPSLWVKYGFINEAASRLSLSGELRVTPNAAGNMPSSYSGQLAAGWRSSETLRLYGVYTLTDTPSTTSSSSIEIGAHQASSENVTLVPRIGYQHANTSSTLSSFSQTSLGLSALIRMSPGDLLVPGVALYRNSAASSSDAQFARAASHNGRHVSLGWHHQF